MLQTEVRLAPRADVSAVEMVVEACCTAEGLTLTLKGTLVKYPGCVHWHFKRGRERGTLEVTWWPQQRRLWFKVQAGRTGEWVEEAGGRLKQVIEKALQSRKVTHV